METNHKYDYYRQENGNYTIFSVPIFSTTNENGREVSIENLQNIVHKMQAEKERGWYARLIVGHQSDEDLSENAPGVGYVDNFKLEENILYADFVEVTPDAFQALQDKKLPGRSCEYRQSEELIESLALLESRTPFFRFPVFAMGEEVQEVSRYHREAALLRFQAISNTNSLKGGINPGIEETHRKKEGFVAKNKAMRNMRNKLRSLEKQLKAYQDAAKFMEDAEKDDDDYMDDEMKVAKEDAGEFQDDEKEEVSIPEKEDETDDYGDIKAYMDECVKKIDDGMKYMDECMQKMQSYMAGMDSPSDLDSLAMQDDANAKKYTQSIGQNARTIAGNYTFTKENNNIVSKYAAETEEVRDVAINAARDWEDTVNQRNKVAAKKFQNNWPDKEVFVAKAVEQEKASPGSYYKIFHA